MEQNDKEIAQAVDRRDLKAHLAMNTKEHTMPGRIHTDFVDTFLAFQKGILFLNNNLLYYWVFNQPVMFEHQQHFPDCRKPLAWLHKYFWSIYFFSFALIRSNFPFQWWTGKCQCWALNKALRNFNLENLRLPGLKYLPTLFLQLKLLWSSLLLQINY